MDNQSSALKSSSSMFSSDRLVVTGGTFVQVLHSSHRTSFDILTDNVAHSAFHNSSDSFDAPKCHENTRIAVLQKIMDWITGQDLETRDKYLFWLTGAAGAGKSAIAFKIVELCIQKGILVLSFFFKRSDGSRNNEKQLISTLAYQLASSIQAAKPFILSVIDSDPLIFKKSLDHQFQWLVGKPLQSADCSKSDTRCLLVIDGLDECVDRGKRVQIMDMTLKAIHQLNLPIYFLIASRPEHEIKAVFNSHDIQNVLSRLVLDHGYQSYEEIRRFVSDSLRTIKRDHPFRDQIPQSWPMRNDIDKVAQKSSGQFIYAATVVRYVQSLRHLPHKRLGIATQLTSERGDMPFAELDSLYQTILSSVQNLEKVLQILAFCIISSQLDATSSRSPRWSNIEFPVWRYSKTCNVIKLIEHVFALDPGELNVLFCDLGSIISLTSTGFIKFLHASFEDFICDASRAGGYFIDITIYQPIILSKIINSLYYHTSLESRSFDGLLFLFAQYLDCVPISSEILSTITQFRLKEFIRTISKNRILVFDTRMRLFFVQFLRILKRIGQSHLHIAQSHQQTLDNLFISHMDNRKFGIDSKLIVFLTIICIAGSDPLVPITRVHIEYHNYELLPSEILKLNFSTLIPFDLSTKHAYNPGTFEGLFCSHIAEFLLDSSRSRKHSIGPKQYAQTAAYCIQELRTRAQASRLGFATFDESKVYLHYYGEDLGSKWITDFSNSNAIYLLSGYVLYFLPRSEKNIDLGWLCRAVFQSGFGDWAFRLTERHHLLMKAMQAYIKNIDFPEHGGST